MAGQPPFAVHISLTVSTKSVYLDLAERLMLVAVSARTSPPRGMPMPSIVPLVLTSQRQRGSVTGVALGAGFLCTGPSPRLRHVAYRQRDSAQQGGDPM